MRHADRMSPRARGQTPSSTRRSTRCPRRTRRATGISLTPRLREAPSPRAIKLRWEFFGGKKCQWMEGGACAVPPIPLHRRTGHAGALCRRLHFGVSAACGLHASIPLCLSPFVLSGWGLYPPHRSNHATDATLPRLSDHGRLSLDADDETLQLKSG